MRNTSFFFKLTLVAALAATIGFIVGQSQNGRPDPTKFAKYDDYIEALVDWKVRTLLPSLLAAQSGSATAVPGSSCDPAIESSISGTFNGWNGDTIYKLDNGQLWQQSAYHYHYHYAYHPEVLIYAMAGGCRIRVSGDDDDGNVSVRRLR